MKIIRLAAENVKRLKAVEITPSGHLVVVGGANDAGKTSVLDSIMYALAGAGAHAARPVRKGQKRATIRLELGDGTETKLVVRKTIAAEGGAQLVVEAADGVPQRSPQAMLNALVGAISFDPSEFARMKPADQLETLKRLVGLDFAEQDAQRARLYERRRVVGRQAREAAASAQATEFHPDAPAEPVDVALLAAELEERLAMNAANDGRRAALKPLEREAADAGRQIENAEERVEDAKHDLARAQAVLKAAKKRLKDAEKAAADAAKEVETLEDADVRDVRARIAEAKAVNDRVSANAARAAAMERSRTLAKDVDVMTAEIEALDAAKREAVEKAEFPVPDLGFDDDGVTFGGVPFDQASQSERWRTSIAIGLALNPRLKVMLVREGALLDDDHLAMVAEMAKDNDAQVWIEDVGDDRASIVIEDGEVKRTGVKTQAKKIRQRNKQVV
jgi:hypothetical protein